MSEIGDDKSDNGSIVSRKSTTKEFKHKTPFYVKKSEKKLTIPNDPCLGKQRPIFIDPKRLLLEETKNQIINPIPKPESLNRSGIQEDGPDSIDEEEDQAASLLTGPQKAGNSDYFLESLKIISESYSYGSSCQNNFLNRIENEILPKVKASPDENEQLSDLSLSKESTRLLKKELSTILSSQKEEEVSEVTSEVSYSNPKDL